MGKIMNWVYGGVLIFLALDALWLGWLPSDLFRALLVIIMGIFIFWTNQVRVSSDGTSLPVLNAPHTSGPFFRWIRRWFFGGFITLVGLVSLLIDLDALPNVFEFLSFISLEEWAGPWLILVIGAIYLLASFKKTRAMDISTL